MQINKTAPHRDRAYVQDALSPHGEQLAPTEASYEVVARYWDRRGTDHHGRTTPGLVVRIERDISHVQSVTPKKNFKGEDVPFKSREALLDHEVARRMEAKQDRPGPERYLGLTLSPKQKLYRLFGRDIDNELQDAQSTVMHPSLSANHTRNMKVMISPSREIRNCLHLEDHETHKLATKVSWCFNSSLNGYTYLDEKGKLVTLRNGVTSCHDKTTSSISMMRCVDDANTDESIAYTGRPDTRDKALEQLTFIFRNEMKKSQEVRKGITEENGTYTLTYLVTNLMNPLDEKEKNILEKLSGQVFQIDGKRVRAEPIYFAQPFDRDVNSGKNHLQAINTRGYAALFSMASQKMLTMPEGKNRQLLEAAIRTLSEGRHSLLPEEELFNRTLISQLLKIPLVTHCCSSTKQTSLAIATAAISHQWKNLGLDFIKNDAGYIAPHLILKEEASKELFAGHCLGERQITQIESPVKKGEGETRIFGFDCISNPIPGRMLPRRYTQSKSPRIETQKVIDFLPRGLTTILHPFLSAKTRIDPASPYHTISQK